MARTNTPTTLEYRVKSYGLEYQNLFITMILIYLVGKDSNIYLRFVLSIRLAISLHQELMILWTSFKSFQ